uniref:Suppressor of tumorigenicity 7 protein n=1 Tax=Gallus gallus TaxID=9031 RepID=A0A8V0X8U1_CHICK
MVFFFPFFFFFFLLKNMAEAGTGFLEQLKSCIVWSWTYLWTLWFFIMLFLVYILRVPLKINDNLTTGRHYREAADFSTENTALKQR